MNLEKQEEFRRMNPFREIRQAEQYFTNWTNGLVSDGEIVHRLAGASAAIAYLHGIVGQSMMDDEEQLADAKFEAAGLGVKQEEVPF